MILNAYNSTLVISRIFHNIVPLCGETIVIGGFLLQRESNADGWYDGLAQRSGDKPSSGSIMAISPVTHTVAGQCDQSRYDVAYVELITALNIVGYLCNSQELMVMSTRPCLQNIRRICRKLFPGDGFKWITVVNSLGNTTYHFQSLVYNARISRWWWPTTSILQLWAESADWIISRL